MSQHFLFLIIEISLDFSKNFSQTFPQLVQNLLFKGKILYLSDSVNVREKRSKMLKHEKIFLRSHFVRAGLAYLSLDSKMVDFYPADIRYFSDQKIRSRAFPHMDRINSMGSEVTFLLLICFYAKL